MTLYLKRYLEILDIKAVLNNNVLCDIEVQVGNNHDDDKRILDYWAKMYRQSIGKSKNYINMKRTIVIFIAAYDIDQLKNIKEYKTRWKIKEEKINLELTNIFQVDIIELSKATRLIKKKKFDEEKALSEWIKFLIDPRKMEGINMDEMSQKVKEAYEEWQKLNANAAEREAAEERFLELASNEYGRKYEYNLGIEKGKEKEQLETAKRMLKEGIDMEVIMRVTELSKEKIEKLRRQLKIL